MCSTGTESDRLRLPNAGFHPRSAADQRSRRSRSCSIAIRAAGVTIKGEQGGEAQPEHDRGREGDPPLPPGPPPVISRVRNSTLMPNAIGSTPRIAVTAVSTTGRARSRQVSMIAS